ncbi:hypothetical protein BJV77DRAFT_968056 [Russula vinacea]|nr:hypothetical protein BJV77DRAFT_968056 [Russula vinacea]
MSFNWTGSKWGRGPSCVSQGSGYYINSPVVLRAVFCQGGGGVSCRLYLYFSLSVWNWPISTLVCARATKGALFATGLAQHDHILVLAVSHGKVMRHVFVGTGSQKYENIAVELHVLSMAMKEFAVVENLAVLASWNLVLVVQLKRFCERS